MNEHVGRAALTSRRIWPVRTVTASTPKPIRSGRCPARTRPVGTATAAWRRTCSSDPPIRYATANSFAATATIPTAPTTTSSTSGRVPTKPALHAIRNSGGRSCGNTHRWWRTACSAIPRMDRTSPRSSFAARHSSARRATRHRATAVSRSAQTSCRRARRRHSCSPRHVSTATAKSTGRTIRRGTCSEDEARGGAVAESRGRRGRDPQGRGLSPPAFGSLPRRVVWTTTGEPQGSWGRPRVERATTRVAPTRSSLRPSGSGTSAVAGAIEPNYANVDTERWRCRLCPFELANPNKATWTVGAIQVNDAHARFGRDNGLDRSRCPGGCESSPISGVARTVARIAIAARRLGLDSRSVGVEVRRQPHHVASRASAGNPP